MKSEKICSRYGLKYSYIERRGVGDRVYIYAVHYLKVGGRRLESVIWVLRVAVFTSPECMNSLLEDHLIGKDIKLLRCYSKPSSS